MTKKDVIEKVKALQLPDRSYILFGACTLAALGIREVNDIDMLISADLYKELEQQGWKKLYKSPKDQPLTSDVFEAHDNWNFSKYNPTLEEMLTRALYIDDVAFASLEDVRKWKKVSSRPKDFTDLKLIDNYLKQNKN